MRQLITESSMRINQYKSDWTILLLWGKGGVTGVVCPNILESYTEPQLPDRYIFQQDGAPPHF
jgi:hypothetical protein